MFKHLCAENKIVRAILDRHLFRVAYDINDGGIDEIGHGGPALNKSALMPPYGYTLSKTEIEALIAYIRLISDPPYHASGMVYAQK